jgi:hypothetical protein
MDVLEIPGYAEAVIRERVVRDAAFLGITESIGPFEVVPLTLRHWLILRLMRSPFLTKETPSPNDVFNFLWMLSTTYSPGDKRAKSRFERRCRHCFFLAIINTRWARSWHEVKRLKRLTAAANIIDSIRAFMEESLQDRPPVQKTKGFEADYYSDAAFFCCLFGREFGWSQEETLNMPMKRLFQCLNEIREKRGGRTPLSNPSDSVKAKWLRDRKPNRPSCDGH